MGNLILVHPNGFHLPHRVVAQAPYLALVLKEKALSICMGYLALCTGRKRCKGASLRVAPLPLWNGSLCRTTYLMGDGTVLNQ